MRLIAQLGTITPPAQLGPLNNGTGQDGLNLFITGVLNILIAISAVVFLFMIIWGGFNWITSGGNKEKIAGARNRIQHAVIGIAIVGLGAFIANVIGSIFGFTIY